MHVLPSGHVNEQIDVVRTGVANWYLYHRDDVLICIDSGYGLAAIRKGLDHLGIDPLKITHCFLTHSDPDHAGGLALLRNATIYLSEAEKPLLDGTTKRFYWHKNTLKAKEFHWLKDGDIVMAGSVRIEAIATPGHTPGSMSYRIDGTSLFTGDTFAINRKGLIYPLLLPNMDRATQKKSIRKLADLSDVSIALTAHDGYTTQYQRAMQKWIRS